VLKEKFREKKIEKNFEKKKFLFRIYRGEKKCSTRMILGIFPSKMGSQTKLSFLHIGGWRMQFFRKKSSAAG